MMIHAIPDPYRKHFWVDFDDVMRRTATIATSIGMVFLLIVLIAPYRTHTITEVEEVPERFAKLILKEPAPPAAAPQQAETQMKTPEMTEKPKAEAAPPPPKPVRREKPAPVSADVGKVGREKAKQDVTKSLAGASTAADAAIKNLAGSLGQSDTKTRTRPRSRRSSVSGGRSAGQLGAVTHGSSGSGASVDVAGSGVTASTLVIEELTPVAGGSGDGSSDAGGENTGGASNPYRSNASLMAVVRRYAPGIQFCYDNELKRAPGIRGKMVVAITVAASGAVTDARVVSNTVGSNRLSECALAQIREWRFPAVPSGDTVFRAPFVFTPPKE